MFKIFLQKYKSPQALPQDVLLCYRWILMTSFGIPPKIKWAIIVYDLAYCSVVYIHVFGQIGAIFFTGMIKIPWGHLTSLCLRQMILRSILSAWEEKHINVVLVISWLMGIVGPVTQYRIVFHSNLHFLQEAKEGDAERIRIMKMVKVWYGNDFSRPHKKFVFFWHHLESCCYNQLFFYKAKKTFNWSFDIFYDIKQKNSR